MTTSERITVDFDPFAGPEVQVTIPATDPQKEIWLSARMGADASCAFNESLSIELDGVLDRVALQTAVDSLVARHESLRASFSPDGTLMCVASRLEIPIREVDLGNLAGEDCALSLAALRAEAVSTPFDLEKGPLVRVALLRLSETKHVLLFTAHHIVCDGWSFAVMLRELAKLYSSAKQGVTARLPDADRFFDYALVTSRHASSAEASTSISYWASSLADTPASSDLPSDLPRPPLRTFESERVDYVLPPDLVSGLKSMGAKNGASLFATLLSGFAAYLHRWSQQDDMVIGIPSAGQAGTGALGLVGHCVNLLPIRIRPSGSTPFDAHLRAVRVAVLDAQDHKSCTFGRIIQSLKLPRDPSRMPLLSIQFNLEQGLDSKELSFDGLQAVVRSNPRKFENFEMFVNAVESGGKVVLEVQYNSNLFQRGYVERRMQGLEALLRGIVANPAAEIAALPVMGSEESRELQAAWHSTRRIWDGEPDILALFEECATRHGGRIALCDTCGSGPVTFAELWSLSGSLARSLREAGVLPGELVGLGASRSVRLPVAMLGILRAGAAYVPLDPSYPRERLEHMIGSSSLARILVDRESGDRIPDCGASKLWLDEMLAASPLEDRGIPAPPNGLAYVIFTSGSTGTPKGVEVPRSCLYNFLRSMSETPGIGPDDSLLAVTTLSFDIAALELLLPLAVGAKLIVASREDAADGDRLLSLIREHSITTMQATPSTWRLMLDAGMEQMPGLRALCGGEALPRDLLPGLLERVGSLWNMYGPTETTIWSSCGSIATPEGPITVGRPIANTRVYVLDPALRHVAVGWPGEIYIAGDGVAKGYLGREDLTAERFLDDPFVPGDRMYRTGDIGRVALGGELEVLGRSDNQVKVRGYRIELGEIESAISLAEGVKQAIAVVREDNPGDSRIVAYVVPTEGEEIRQTEIRKLLRRKLPEYMIPSLIVEIEAAPMTDNGKIDRKRLPAPSTERRGDAGDLLPLEGDTEMILGALWREILGTQQIGANDNFFNAGGHSLLAFKVIASIDKQFGIKLPPRSMIFDSLRNIARTIDGLVAEKGIQRERAA